MRCEQVKFSTVTLLLVLSVSFVFAAHIITTSTGTTTFSVNETIQNTFNITVNNTDVGLTNITYVNITIPTQFTFTSATNGTNVSVSAFENTSTVLSWSNTTSGFPLVNKSEVAYFWFNATATPGSYNFTILTVNSTGTSTTNISVVVNDTTSPTATLGTSPADYANSSTAANTFDLKCSDAYNVSSMVLWGNWSGSWAVNNSNTTITNNTYSNISVTLSDGIYKWAAYCNDSTGNEDWSANRTLIVDTTNPTPTAACTPESVYEGSLVTCTCSGTDATSGVNSSATTATSTSYPTTIGTYTYTCSVTDYSGNSASGTDTYNVIAYGSSSSSSSGSTWSGGTQTVTETQFKESFSGEVSLKGRLKMRINSVYHHVGVTELTATTATLEIASTPQQATLTVGDEKKFEVSGDNYYDILVKLNSIENNKANITVQSINELVTTETTTEENQVSTTEEANNPEVETSSISKTMWIIIIIVVIILVGGIIYIKTKR